jgi:hypothetical protein
MGLEGCFSPSGDAAFDDLGHQAAAAQPQLRAEDEMSCSTSPTEPGCTCKNPNCQGNLSARLQHLEDRIREQAVPGKIETALVWKLMGVISHGIRPSNAGNNRGRAKWLLTQIEELMGQ